MATVQMELYSILIGLLHLVLLAHKCKAISVPHLTTTQNPLRQPRLHEYHTSSRIHIFLAKSPDALWMLLLRTIPKPRSKLGEVLVFPDAVLPNSRTSMPDPSFVAET